MILHFFLFLLVGWFVSLAFFSRHGESAGEIVQSATIKLLRYVGWTILLAMIMWGLELLFIYPGL